jgi:MoaA/NifB/PqqE/SkfB family radical SAM enzyme
MILMGLLYKIIPADKIMKIQTSFLQFILRKQHKLQKCIHYLEISVVDHCNLNCKYCANFSPLAQKTYLDIIDYEKDCRKLSEISMNNVETIRLLGGEPLLHDKLEEIIFITRKYFSQSRIELVTNGLLLLKMNDDFWRSCSDNTIIVSISHYPIKINYKAIQKTASRFKVTVSYSKFAQPMFKWVLDIDGKQNSNESYLKCHRSNICVTLRNGKIYPCSMIPYVRYFNRYFNKELLENEQDSFDLYQTNCFDEILLFLSKAVPFCKYCNPNNIIYSNKWEISKREITEWT